MNQDWKQHIVFKVFKLESVYEEEISALTAETALVGSFGEYQLRSQGDNHLAEELGH